MAFSFDPLVYSAMRVIAVIADIPLFREAKHSRFRHDS